MPVENNSTKQVSAALDYLLKKWPNPRECPICHENSWVVGAVYSLRRFTDGEPTNSDDRGRIFPVTPVTCVNCGYTMLFNSIVANAVDPDVPRPENGGKNLE